MKKFLAIIPARYASTRFPGKPLALLGGKPIVQWVYERVNRVFEHTVVATDDQRIFDCVEQFGGKAVMTSTNHKSGTDRCFEALNKSGVEADVVVNVQGDEPFIAASQLESIKRCFEDDNTDIATLVQPFTPSDGLGALQNPNSPKVVVGANDYALYFSRSAIPFLRGVEPSQWQSSHTYYKHIGLYAYRSDVLRKITALPQGILERCESLEQLRWLENGYRIRTAVTMTESLAIDTPQDLQAAVDYMLGRTK